jgi:hypothetical protein
MRKCTKCGEVKGATEFWPDRRRKAGLMARCKSCKVVDARDYRRAHPECEHRRYWKNPQSERERHLIRKYGVTQADYDRMLTEQGGGCAICRKTQDRAFDVDHDHSTGRVRGLLCTNCNRMVGHAADSPERLEAAAAYLRIVPQAAAEYIAAYLDLERGGLAA